MGNAPSAAAEMNPGWSCRCGDVVVSRRGAWRDESRIAGDEEVAVDMAGSSPSRRGASASDGDRWREERLQEQREDCGVAPALPAPELRGREPEWSRKLTVGTEWSRLQTPGADTDGASDSSSMCSGTEDEVCSSASSSSSTRNPKRRKAKNLRVIETMGMVPSASLQVVIDNHGDLEDFYDVEAKPLGQGSFGVVRQAKVKVTGAARAVKSINKEKMKEKRDVLKHEIEIMKMIDHPNLVMLHEIFEDTEFLYLVMELCSGGHLEARVKKAGRLREGQAAAVFRHILRGVHYMHAHRICHRDLKAENILLGNSDPLERCVVKLSDFGLSCVVSPKQVLTSCAGTRSHMAPEVLAKKYDISCDLWSCGVILYFFLSGYLPFAGDDEVRAAKVAFSSKEWLDVSQDAINLISSLLTKNARKRSTAKQALREPWIKQRAPPPAEVTLQRTLIRNLCSFRSLNKFKRATLSVVVNMLDEADVSVPRATFNALDLNGDGIISLAELKRALAEQGGEGMDIVCIFQDVSAGGKVLKEFTYTEFLAATFDRKHLRQTGICRTAFKCFDKNGDGTISMAELAKGHLLGHLSMEELVEILNSLDRNGDAHIDFEEFTAMLHEEDAFPVCPVGGS